MNARSAIILLNWNGWRDTVECLESLRLLDHSSFAVIVVDNDSADGSIGKIMNWCVAHAEATLGFQPIRELSEATIPVFHEGLHHREVILVKATANGGFAAGNNLGLQVALQAGCERMWLLNNDTVVDPLALSALEHRMVSEPSVGMVGSMLRFYHDRNIVQAVGGVAFDFWRARGTQIGQGLEADSPEIVDMGKDMKNIELTYISGASMLVRNDFLLEIGLMEENYFLYFEEIDWAIRARGRWKIATALDSLVFHKEGGTIGTASLGTRSSLSQYYLNRNLIRFYWLRCPALLPIAVARVCREALLCLYCKNIELFSVTCKALADALLGRFGKKVSS